MTTAAVIGSGPNGLAAAIRLAQAGLDVTVIEAHERPGGGTRTSELTVPGLLHDECSAFHPMGVASPFFRSLDLERHGLTWRWPEIDLAHPLDGGYAALLGRDAERTMPTLSVDILRWQRRFKRPVKNFDKLMADVLRPPLHLPRHPVVMARFGFHALRPAQAIVHEFSQEPAKALFMGNAAHAFGRLDTPMSAAVGLALAASAQAVGWPVAEGGSEAITRALLAELDSLGGRVVTGTDVTSRAQVAEILGATPDVLMLDTAPAGALQILGDDLPGRVRRQLGRYRYGPAAFKVDFAIDGEIPWLNDEVRHAGTVHLGGPAGEVAAIEKATWQGQVVERPFTLLGQQYVADPTRSKGSINPVYAYAHVPHGYDGDATDAVIGQIERFAPGFRDRIVATSTRNPATLAAYNANYVGGDISAGANNARQLIFRPRVAVNPYALGIRGVYLCSSATPPGGGVHGMGGFRAAEAALRRL